MQNIKEYIKSVRFSLGYSFQFVPKESFLMLGLYIFAGVLPYANAYLLGTLVNTIVRGAKTGLYTNIWYILIFYAFISALPAIIGNIQIYINRRRLLIMQMEADLGVLKNENK